MDKFNRILLVDRDAQLCLMLRSLLENRGVRVAVSSGGVEAHRILREHQIELLVADNGFRSAAGLELADYARTLRIPTMLMSAEFDGEEKLATGPHPYILKPFRASEFTDKVQAVLEGSNVVGRSHDSDPVA